MFVCPFTRDLFTVMVNVYDNHAFSTARLVFYGIATIELSSHEQSSVAQEDLEARQPAL